MLNSNMKWNGKIYIHYCMTVFIVNDIIIIECIIANWYSH